MGFGGYRLDTETVTFDLTKSGGESFLSRAGSLFWNIFTNFDFTSDLEFGVVGTNMWVASEPGLISFKTFISNVAGDFYSKVLAVSELEDNTKPTAIINFSYDDVKFGVNETIIFDHSSYDEDDLLYVQWDFGDNTHTQISNYALALKNEFNTTEKNYSHGGIYGVELTVLEKDSRRNQRATDYKIIHIFEEGINVHPVITSPPRGFISGTSPEVSFDAYQSYVADCKYDNVTSPDFVAGDLKCNYLHAPGEKFTSNDYNMTIKWLINDKEIRSGSWDTESNVKFSFNYPFSGKHVATLFLTYSY